MPMASNTAPTEIISTPTEGGVKPRRGAPQVLP